MQSAISDELYKKIGLMIREKRQNHEHPLSQENLARRLGMSRTSVVNIELGKQHIQIHTLYQLAEILGIDALELLPSSETNNKVKITSEKELSKKERISIENIISSKVKKKVNLIE